MSENPQWCSAARAVPAPVGVLLASAFSVPHLIYTHSGRLQAYEDLKIDCPGDEYATDVDDSLDRAPCFGFDDGHVEFGEDRADSAVACYGSASGFLSL